MKAQTLANEMHTNPRRIAYLEPRELDVWTVLCQDGPVLQLGTLLVTEDAWLLVPRNLIWLACDLHECGHWGAVDADQEERNTRALGSSKGSVFSLWSPKDAPDFWVVTDLSELGNTTEVVAP